jgi:hypothetical protein
MICSKCKKDLDVSCFSNRGGGKLHKQCKTCKAEAIKRHYENNKADYIKRAKKKNGERKFKITEILNELKSVPCKDCNVKYPPYIMDFDHVSGEKFMNIGDMKSRISSFDKIFKEVEKCEVVCSNCHRERTHQRRINTAE